ncbi:hypothetical protein ACFL6P_01425 [Candidatus Latescibacterota bacterium]
MTFKHDIFENITKRFGTLWETIIAFNNGVTLRIKRNYARYRRSIIIFQFRIAALKTNYGKQSFAFLLFFLLFVASIYLTYSKYCQIESYFASNDLLSQLRSLFLTLGGALIGATAIAFTLIMFAMQVNIERMPYGLFRQISQDARIMLTFVATFILAFIITGFSLIPDESWVVVFLFSSIWATIVILLLFLYAFRRALLLINPIKQLAIVVKVAEKSMKQWKKISKKIAPLYGSEYPQEQDNKFTIDMNKVNFFRNFPNWTYWADQSIQQSIFIAKRYAGQGDYEVSAAALNSVAIINQYYVDTKGKTFFNNSGLLETPLSTDYFIINTLEHLRKIVKTGVSLGDEQLIEEIFRTFAKLVEVYASIDYGKTFETKAHAQLAINYLFTAVKSVVPHGMTDVLMEGSRMMGQSANILLKLDKPESIITTTNNLSLLAYAGTIDDNHMPVTITAMEQLSLLTYNLIRSTKHEIGLAAKEIRNAVKLIAEKVLTIPDIQRERKHNNYLSAYYSGLNTQSLLHSLINLANSIGNADAKNEKAKIVINNFEKWADGIYSNEKEILLLAIEKRSSFTLDIIDWIKTITNVLLVVSNSPACDDYSKEKIQRHALHIISQLSWIPDDIDTVKFIVRFDITETLFEAVVLGHNSEFPEISKKVQKHLLYWGFKAGRHNIGWAILEHSIYGLATLALSINYFTSEGLKEQIKDILGQSETPDQDIKDKAARNIRRKANNLHRDRYTSRKIEYNMTKTDTQEMKELLIDIADIISPNTASEPIPTRPF